MYFRCRWINYRKYATFNQAWIEALPDDVEAVFEEALTNLVSKERREVFAAANEECKQICIDGGATFTDQTAETMAEWKALAETQYEAFAEVCGGMENVTAAQKWLAENGY
ncbi:MAG: hypothetical protein V8R80_10980 [Eubacterium sp.]